MKIAISVPDRVHRAADRAARSLGIPRSQLYVQAVETYLEKAAREDVTERLYAVYGSQGQGGADPFLTASGQATLRRNEW